MYVFFSSVMNRINWLSYGEVYDVMPFFANRHPPKKFQLVEADSRKVYQNFKWTMEGLRQLSLPNTEVMRHCFVQFLHDDF